MQDFGERIGKLLTGEEVIELVGDVGAGKTTFVRGLAKGMGVTETVQSPSFTISRLYDGVGGHRLAHYDFYRLADPGIMAQELADTIMTRDTTVIIEWADSITAVLPDNKIRLSITTTAPTVRQVTIEATGENNQRILEQL